MIVYKSVSKNYLAVAVVLAMGGAIYFSYSNATIDEEVPTQAAENIPEGAYVITLTEDGFVPAEVVIPVGETVTFVTTTGSLFWPASNLHPSHTIYPEFDPKEPVQPTRSWSFTFNEVGEWNFHDHLAPYFTGTIIVTE